MRANLGGTEILPPIKATISKRYKDLPLEIMVLTDGEVWNTETLFEYIEKETATGNVRVFSLGIGQDVSHSLVEGMARVGKGFAQIVSDEKEGMEGKVVRMLRGGLSAHIDDYRLEWDGRPTERQIQTSSKGKSTGRAAEAAKKKKISLFDKQADLDPPVSSSSGAARFAHLPAFDVPIVLQAPYKVPPLFPFSRSTAYVILTGDVEPPSSVWLRGTTPSGDELELEIPVQVLPERGHTIHQLAARKLLQELEEGTGYLHSGKYGVDKEKNPGTIGDWVEREGIRVGLAYGLASKWTSFVAVQKKQQQTGTVTIEEKDADDDWMEIESVTEVGDNLEIDQVEGYGGASSGPSKKRKRPQRYNPQLYYNPASQPVSTAMPTPHMRSGSRDNSSVSGMMGSRQQFQAQSYSSYYNPASQPALISMQAPPAGEARRTRSSVLGMMGSLGGRGGGAPVPTPKVRFTQRFKHVHTY